MVEVAKMDHVMSANERQWLITRQVWRSANDLLIQGSHQFRFTIMVTQGRRGCRTFPNDMVCAGFICVLQQALSFARTLVAWLPLRVLPVESSDVRCNFDVWDLRNAVMFSYHGFQEGLVLNSLLIRRKLFCRLDSVVGTATGYGLDGRVVGVRVPVGSRIFSSARRPDRRLCGPPSLLSNGYRGLFPPGVTRQGCEADHSPPISAEVKKMWIYTYTPPYAFLA
jgi:hypothetical protein